MAKNSANPPGQLKTIGMGNPLEISGEPSIEIVDADDKQVRIKDQSPMIVDKNAIISYLGFDSVDGWDTVLEMCIGFVTVFAATRIRQVPAKAVIVEREYIDKDCRNTFSKFHSKKYVTPKSRCIRLHLFSDSVSFAEPNVEDRRRKYLWYTVLRPTLPNLAEPVPNRYG